MTSPGWFCCAVAVLAVSTLSFAQARQTDSNFVVHKTLHAIGGAGISLGVGAATRRPWLGMVAGVGTAFAKEGYDKSQGNTFSGRDVLITSGGAVAGYLVNRYVFHIRCKK